MYLGIDLGTSELKLVLLDRQHRLVASVGERLTVQRPAPLHSEQSPADWWDAMTRAMARLQAGQAAALAQVRAIGLSGQMHGAVLMDAAGEVLRPAILWNDGRSGAECAELEAACPSLHAIAGNLAMPGFTAPKLLWVRRHEPEVFAKTATVLLPKDWLRFMLTGERVGEMSDAAGTLWLDVAERRWSPEVLAACGLTEAQMPRLVEGSEASGTLRPELAARWGLPAGVIVAGGGGDNAASAVGIGAVRPGEGFVSLGTSGVIFLTSDRFRPNPASAMHAFCHALPGTWHQMSVMLSAANGLSWVTRLVGAASEGALLEQVARLSPEQRERAPLFLPYLNGERTPHNNPHAQGSFFGLTNEHDAAALGWSVIEGVTFGLLDGWYALGVQPGEVAHLTLVGGGARSGLWAQLLADAIGVPMVTRHGGEAGGALGAARLAWLADGGTLDEVCPAPEIAATFQPDPAETARLAARHARFRALYRAVAGLFPV
ncbi:xylulokinase [Sphaerotilus uruguayifluvii]|uniref:Xylulose kinase n=1 Tax=Sphaerotilus uruguayifluvii TaxID=2735897 RepID=A0ABX2FZ81_9BURK|nr:xylulokinase [Leptothrix sp. C29]NRT54500.1 xylulokinase [Leptothrix sp. C29]